MSQCLQLDPLANRQHLSIVRIAPQFTKLSVIKIAGTKDKVVAQCYTLLKQSI